ncbi:hypothetical protein PC119_g11881 [Phytophthora cactorum]|uniref:Uncharacterized protein n=1 Tax=Phytophthora cactorum TaxID=29920 RepID=A0A8T1DAM7_9STRA|nr:hypothetical protein PC117_g11875 [Phytophthora cactorum]KAG3015161.1 hypothetical protein PC119_g11881 [Phytophthora cactorum]
MAAALQVADLFDAHAAEAPTHRLVSVLNTQAAQIRELQENLWLLQATQRQTLADCRALHVAVSTLDPRVHTTENDVSALKQFQIAAQRQIEAINRQLQVKADRQEVNDVKIRAKTRSKQLGNELRSELASLQLVQCLQTEQSELHERLETVDRRLSSKMDKSEAARLDGVLVQIHGFRPMVSQLSNQVKSVQRQQEQTERRVARLDAEREAHHIALAEIRQHTNDLQQMLDDVEDRHHQVVAPQIRRLDDTTERLHQALDEAKTAAATGDTALRTLSAKFHSSAGAFANQIQQQYHHLEHVLEEKAPRLETEARIEDLSRQMASKVADTAHKALSSGVKDLQVRCEKLKEHVELSTRFLDWFARRGEAYEHNLELVETQLGRLALASHPRRREPFGERVRFPRSP